MRKNSRQQCEEESKKLGLDLGQREEQVACSASALPLAMTDEACRKRRC